MVTPNILFINYGDNVTLHCRGNGGPNNSYQWSRQGIPLPGEAGDTFIVSDSLVNPEHLGMFTCTVSNAAGSQQASAEIHGENVCVHSVCLAVRRTLLFTFEQYNIY
jgi:hypothetical protein